MKIDFSDLLYAFSYGLDCVENQVVQVEANHGKRVAWLCVLLGRALEMENEDLVDLAGCAVLHDNALTEYIREERRNNREPGAELVGKKLGAHCVMGERNMKMLPFFEKWEGAVLYHHEEADGSGPFGKTAEETPLFAQLIHLSDSLDALFRLSSVNQEKYERICTYVKKQEGSRYSSLCVQAFFKGVARERLEHMREEELDINLQKEVNSGFREYSNAQIHNICNFFAQIIDYKSNFTKKHSQGIAAKAEKMGQYYGWDEDKCTRLYLAGAVHDLGKLAVDSNILEKPDKLTDVEYKHIQSHAYLSWWILSKVRGFEEITRWASYHHEKLNGTGYPFGKTAEELGFEERLMACVDIYQALTEPRPYKDGFSHEKAIGIMQGMVEKNFIDGEITKNLDECFGK